MFKISGAVFTAVLYSIAVFLFYENIPLPASSVSESLSTENSISFESTPSGFLGDPLTQETVIHYFTGIKYAGSEFQFTDFSACLKYSEKTISSEFVQYVFQAKNFPVRLRKADLLFPFHYFW